MARETSGAGCVVRRAAPGTGGWSMRPFRRSEDFELFGRQLGAERGNCILQLAGRNRTFGNVVGEAFLTSERVAWCLSGAAIGAGLSGSGPRPPEPPGP